MKYGKKIKYCAGLYYGKEIIKTAYVLRDDGEYIWVSNTKDELNNGYGATILRKEIRK